MANYTISVDQYLNYIYEFDLFSSDASYVIQDTAANIQSLTPYDLSAAIGVNAISGVIVTDGSVVLTVEQALALDSGRIPVTAPTGDTVTISDTESNIQTLSPDQIAQLSSIGITGFTANNLIPISVSNFVAALGNLNGSGSAPATSFNVTDTAANIQTLTPGQIEEAKSVGLGQLTSTDGSVALTVAQALALETQLVPVAAPAGDKVIVADTAANDESLTTAQIALLPSIGASAIAGTDAPPVFNAAQMTALGNGSVAVTAPPNDPTQTFSDPLIANPHGGGLTFDVSFDSSVASAPAGFVTAVDAAFQFYANLFENPITLYYTVGWGEFGGTSVGSGDLAQNQPNTVSGEPYSAVSTITELPLSLAEQQAWGNLPPSGDVSGDLQLTTADYQALDLNGVGTTGLGNVQGSPSNLDDEVGVATNFPNPSFPYGFSYVTDPTQVPGNEFGLVGVVEHEISEGMGRISALGNGSAYQFMDLFRYSAPGVHQLGVGDPSYFSIDDGVTNLDSWNNYQTGNSGDLGDWAPSAGSDAYLDNTPPGPNPVTPTDILLMNVLGYKVNPTQYFSASQIETMTSTTITFWAFVGVLDFAANDTSVVLTAAQAVAFEAAPTLSYEASSVEITAPTGDTVTLGDTAGDIEALTPAQITALKALGVSAIAVDDASLTLSVAQIDAIEGAKLGLSVPTGDTVTIQDIASKVEGLTPTEIAKAAALGVTGITVTDASVNITVAQAAALENASIPIAVPALDTVTLNDTAAHIETLTIPEIDALAGIGVDIIHATDGSVALSLSQALALEGTPLFVTAPGGDAVTVADTAANIESLTLSEIAGLPAIGVSGIKATDASVTIIIDQALALEAASLSLKTPAGDTVTVFDETDGGIIERLTPAQIEALPSISATALTVDLNDVPEGVNVADAVALESVGVKLVFPNQTSLNFPYVYDTGANLGLLTPTQIAALPAIGIRAIWATDPSAYPAGLPLTVAQAVALENASLFVRGPSLFAPVINLVDDAANLETLTAVDILKLPQISRGQDVFYLIETGPINVTSTGQPLGFSVDQLNAFLQTGLQFVFSVDGGGAVTISGAANAISAFILLHSQAQLDGLKSDGFTGVLATDMSLPLSVADAVKLEMAGLTAAAPAGDTVIVSDFGTGIATLTAQQISLLPTIGVSGISSFSSVQLSVAQAVALEQVSLAVAAPAGDTVTVADTIANLETLTPAELSGLTGIGVAGLGVLDTAANIEALTPAEIATFKSEGLVTLTATDASVALTVSQALALEDPVYVAAPAGDSVTLVDTASHILGLTTSEVAGLGTIGVTAMAIVDTAADIEALTANQIVALGSDKLTRIAATDASVNLTVDQAAALEQVALAVTAPAGDTVTVADTAADIATLTAAELGALRSIGVAAIVAVDSSVQFTVAEALALESGSIVVTAPAGDTAALLDTAANIDTMSPAQLDGLANIGVAAVWVSDPSLTASGAEALESAYTAAAAVGTPPPFGAPPGQNLALTDTAADIQGMSPAQLSALSSIGVDTINVTDQSLTLTVAQALALYDPIPVTVPLGDGVFIADTETAIESLTPTEIEGLAALGVKQIQVSNLTGAAPLNIDGGVTLSIAGAVPDNVAIVFTGAGGVLALGDTADMAGAIYGFSPPDSIDLTDVPFDFSYSGAVALETNAGADQQYLQVSENGNTYDLQIDPSQVFLTPLTFELNPDASGDGSDLTVIESPIGFYETVSSGQTSDGLVIASGGEVEAMSGGVVNRAIVQDGGELIGDNGSTIDDTVIQGGGVLDLTVAAAGAGTIAFASVPGANPGGTLEIDDANPLNATIDGFMPGDAIDLTAIGDDPNAGPPTLLPGNVLSFTEYGSTYTFQLDPSQDFLNDTFVLGQYGGFGADITLVQAPVSTAVTIEPGERVFGASVGEGGSIDVKDGAALNGGAINAGGVVDVEAGGSLGGGIAFGSEGGALVLGGAVLPSATVYGFAPNDLIDLSAIEYDPNGSVLLEQPSSNSQFLQIDENGNSYDLQIDPTQVFLTPPTFELKPDASGDGTDLTVVEPPLASGSFSLSDGQTSDGVVVTQSGSVEAGYGSTVNDAVTEDGGTLTADDGSTVNNALIESGGLLDLTTAAATAGTIAFGVIAAGDPGGSLEIDDTAQLNATIDNFRPGDRIDLANMAYDPAGGADLLPGNELQITEDGDVYDLQLDPSANFSGDDFGLAPDNAQTGTDITANAVPACFCRGTLIRTDRGEAPVEDLVIGDEIVTMSGMTRPIKWIGRRKVAARFADPLRAWPVRIKANALAKGVPSHDLLLSPDHAVYIDDILIQAGALVNGSSIVRETDVPTTFTYYHIELDDHSLLLAENTPAETFIDNVDRLGFDNWQEHEALYPLGKTAEELPFPRAKARRQIPMHIRSTLDALALCPEEIAAVA